MIFDIGKTNKKLMLFNQHYKIVHEETVHFEETTDEDGFHCEDLLLLGDWVLKCYHKWIESTEFQIKAINISAYGASFALIDENDKPIFPLYNYLKPYPASLQLIFYEKYGGAVPFSLTTASPVLGSLNSGLQLFRLKVERNELFQKVKFALHLPQYLSFLITNRPFADITSIGCHTGLWNFQKNQYHQWVFSEQIAEKLPPIQSTEKVFNVVQNDMVCGIGLHDSSAALIPYLKNIKEPFLLISTGTWCVSLNPFNQNALSEEELSKDCLFYISYDGKPIKASRLFAGHYHEVQSKRLSDFFKVHYDDCKQVKFNIELIKGISNADDNNQADFNPHKFDFSEIDLNRFTCFEEAYHHLMMNIVDLQFMSTNLVLKNTPVTEIYIDGGFSNNEVFLQLIAIRFSKYKVFAATVAQASALGAAIAIHDSWNTIPISTDIIKFRQINNS